MTDKTQDMEQLDQELEDLSINVEAFGFPDCGNLRSTKRKDVRQRIKCLKAMLKQRQKDIEFKQNFNEKIMSKSNQDNEILLEKLSAKERKIL